MMIISMSQIQHKMIACFILEFLVLISQYAHEYVKKNIKDNMCSQ